MKKKFLYLFSIIAMIIFIVLPYRTSNLYIHIYFKEVEGTICTLYYSTDTVNGFCIEQHYSSAIDHDLKHVEFCLDGSLDGRITGFRLDFPNQEQVLIIKNIAISSGGVVKRQYSPLAFFSAENIAYTHNIKALDPAPTEGCVYVTTSANESYIILADELCQQITSCYSHFLVTKLAICAFLLAAFYLSKKKLFSATPPAVPCHE